MSRQKTIVKTSIIGIIVNLVLVAFKATIGILVNSIAITLDAVNNLTDASLHLENMLKTLAKALTHRRLLHPEAMHSSMQYYPYQHWLQQ